MAFNRVNAMGVQHGLQSPEELMGADLARRAQMQALMSAGGRAAPGAEMPMPQQAEPQVLNNVGRPAWETDYMSRAAGQERQMQELQGGQAMDLQKQRGQDYLNAVKEQMAPANAGAALEGQKWGDLAGRRGIEDEALRNQNYLEGAKANILRSMLPSGMGGSGGSDMQQPGTPGNAGAERLLMILNGQNPDKQNIEVQTLQQQLDLMKQQNAEKSKLIPGAGIQESYNQAMPMLQGDLNRMKNFIRSNNWSIGGNKDQLRNLYNAAISKAANMGLSPQAYKLFEQELQNTMRDALQENGMFFESAGSDAVRQEYGL